MGRRTFLAAGAAGAAGPILFRGSIASAAARLRTGPTTGLQPRAFGFPPTDLTSKVTRPITFPVVGTVTWVDSFGDCRDNCSRVHEGQDLMGTKLQKLVACVDGKVVALTHAGDGNYLYLEDHDGWYYGYLHINNDDPGTDDGKNPLAWAFVPGLAVGSTVTAGQHIAYLGDSGNAEDAGAHLHFEVRRPTSQGVWHSQAVNPKYSLVAATHVDAPASSTERPTDGLTRNGPYVPWAAAGALVAQQYTDILGRTPGADELARAEAVLTSGQHTPAWFIQSLVDSSENQSSAGALTRLYRAYFARDPDGAGFDYWIGRLRTPKTPATSPAALSTVSEQFATSAEFVHTYGSTSDADFVHLVYRSVLGRDGDATGVAFWTGRLAAGRVTRGGLMLQFSESNEYRTLFRTRVRTILITAQMLRSIPTSTLVDFTMAQLTHGSLTVPALIDQVRLSDEYRARFA